MTTGDVQQTCGDHTKPDHHRSTTTLSTIAVQASQSQLVVSILKSGSDIHLQLVQVQPGLCEIGLTQRENRTLIQDLQQLLDKLRKHEPDAMAAVEQKNRAERRERRRQGGMKEQEEEQEAVLGAMVASLREGWSLLLRLLERRRSVLSLAADFHCRAAQFAASLDQVEDLHITPDKDRLTEVQLTYDSMRRDLLGKSLQLLNCSSVLMQKLRQLQRTEALQRMGEILQGTEQEQEEEEVDSQLWGSSQSPLHRGDGAVSMMEQLLERLQDRRIKVDQLLRAQTRTRVWEAESGPASPNFLILPDYQDLDPIQESGSTSAEPHKSRIEDVRDQELACRSDPKSELTLHLKSHSRLNIEFRSTHDIEPEFSPDLESGSSLEDTGKFKLESGTHLKATSRPKDTSDVVLPSGFRENKKPKSRPEGIRNLLNKFKSNLKTETKSDENPESTLDPRSKTSKDLPPESRSDLQPGPEVQPGSGLDLHSGWKPAITKNQIPRSRSDLNPGLTFHVKVQSRLDTESRSASDTEQQSRSEMNSGPRFVDTSESQLESTSVLKLNPRAHLSPTSRPEKTGEVDSKTESRKNTKDQEARSDSDPLSEFKSGKAMTFEPGSILEPKLEPTSGDLRDLQPRSRRVETRSEHFELRSDKTEVRPTFDVESNPTSDGTNDFHSEPRSVLEPKSSSGLKVRYGPRSVETEGLESGFREAPAQKNEQNEDSAHQTLLTNQRQQLLSSLEHLTEKLCVWIQQSSSVLRHNSEAEATLFKAEDALNTHLQLYTQAESAGRDAEQLQELLDQLRTLQGYSSQISRTSRTSPQSLSAQFTPLKALTDQLKRGFKSSTNRPPVTSPPGAASPDLVSRVGVVLKELQSLRGTLESNLQLLRPYISLLRTTQQVQEEAMELKEVYRRRNQEEQEIGSSWQETQQRLLAAQELGDTLIHIVPMVSGSGLDLLSVVSAVQQAVQQLGRTQEDLDQMRDHQQVQVHQNQVQQVQVNQYQVHQWQVVEDEEDENVDDKDEDDKEHEDEDEEDGAEDDKDEEEKEHEEEDEKEDEEQDEKEDDEEAKRQRRHQDRLLKTLQDLNGVSELLDSCTQVDLGSDLHTSKLLQSFSQAQPHFTRLDTEVETLVRSREGLEGGCGGGGRAQDRTEEEALQELQHRVKQKIQQSMSILQLSTSFHLTANQLEALLRSKSTEAEPSQIREDQVQIQKLFETATTLKTDVCAIVSHSGAAGFQVEQLKARCDALSLLCNSWLSAASRQEEKVRRDQLSRLLLSELSQLRDSFRELKKRFSNLKFNFLKRNDRTRSTKALRNQLQQVELYEDKLQVLRNRVQGATTQLGSEVKHGGVTREVEDAADELQRMMGELERSVCEHRKTLDMTSRLQQAMEEYQLWCEEASATVARVGRFCSACRSTEAVSVLYRQFEKFVWPTVPEQEERISQITELAVRLHGAEEGRRYMETTVSKHSEMVESIRELSHGLMELENKLKLDSLKQRQKEEEEEGKEESRRDQSSLERGMKKEERRAMKRREQSDNRRTQEATDMSELKETGHTPELTAEHDGKEVALKKQSSTNRKPPLQKSHSQEAVSDSRRHNDRFTSSYSSTHTLSLSCSAVEAGRRLHAIHTQSQLTTLPTEAQTTPPPAVTGPLFSDIQREFHQDTMACSCDSNTMQLQETSEGGLLEALMDDSLSNYEYECASPDDISLPPLAETPESSMVHSDHEEGYCFSSHSVHVHQSHSHPEPTVRQQRETSQSCPIPPRGPHSSTRFRSECGSVVQSPLTLPAPSILTSALCSIPRTDETKDPTSAPDSIKSCTVLYPTSHSCSTKENNVHDTKNKPDIIQNVKSQIETMSQDAELNQSCVALTSESPQPDRTVSNIPHTVTQILKRDPTFIQTSAASLSQEPARDGPSSTSTQRTMNLQSSTSQNDSYMAHTVPPIECLLHTESLLKTDPVHQATKLVSIASTTDSVLHTDSLLPQDHSLPKSLLPQHFPVWSVCEPQSRISFTSNTAVPQQTILSESPSTGPQRHSTSPRSHVPKSESCPQVGLVHRTRQLVQGPGDTVAVLQKDKTIPQPLKDKDLKSTETSAQTNTTKPPDLPFQSSPAPDGNQSKTRKEVEGPISTTAVIQQTGSIQFLPSDCATSAPATEDSSQGSSPSQWDTLPRTDPVHQITQLSQSPDLIGSGPHENRTRPGDDDVLKSSSSLSQDNCITHLYQSRKDASADFTSRTPEVTLSEAHTSPPPEPPNVTDSHQAVYSFHGSLTAICAQQCVHDSGMTPSTSARPAVPSQPDALPPALAQLANPHVTLPSSPLHLLTSDQDPDICLPVAICEEIRLTPQIRGPSLPAFPHHVRAESLPHGKASRSSLPYITRPLSRATVMEGSSVTLEVAVTGHPEPTLTWSERGPAVDCDKAGAASHQDSGLLVEVLDIIGVDWLTWFGSLCVLLWLLYLVLL